MLFNYCPVKPKRLNQGKTDFINPQSKQCDSLCVTRITLYLKRIGKEWSRMNQDDRNEKGKFPGSGKTMQSYILLCCRYKRFNLWSLWIFSWWGALISAATVPPPQDNFVMEQPKQQVLFTLWKDTSTHCPERLPVQQVVCNTAPPNVRRVPRTQTGDVLWLLFRQTT